MSNSLVSSVVHLNQHGYVMLEGVFERLELDSFADRLSACLETREEPSILRSRGQTYGSRNLLQTFPEVTTLLSCPELRTFVTDILGPSAGIVRALYFDKPPNRSWSLPWHKDRTIAVKSHDLPSEHFRRPTLKAGVPHVEAPTSLLEKMLTLRIHLDVMNEANGPLCVIPGSHWEDHQHQAPIELHANVGDVLAMRPLLSHSSAMSRPGTTSHRRVIHFEASCDTALPDGFEWYSFIPFG